MQRLCRGGLRSAGRAGRVGAERSSAASGSGSTSWRRSATASGRTLDGAARRSRISARRPGRAFRSHRRGVEDARRAAGSEVEDRLARLDRLKRQARAGARRMCSRDGRRPSPSASSCRRRSAPEALERRAGGGRARLPDGGPGAVAPRREAAVPLGARNSKSAAGRPGDGAHALRASASNRSSRPIGGRRRASTPRSSSSRPNPGEDAAAAGARSRRAASCRGSCWRCTPSALDGRGQAGEDAGVPERTLIFDEVDAGIGGARRPTPWGSGSARWAAGSRCSASRTCRADRGPRRRRSSRSRSESAADGRVTVVTALGRGSSAWTELSRMLARSAGLGRDARQRGGGELRGCSEARSDGAAGAQGRKSNEPGERRKRKSEADGHERRRALSVETFGCQMNVHDSERMAGLLEQAGYEPRRGRARRRRRGGQHLQRPGARRGQALHPAWRAARPRRRDRPARVVVVAGCVAQQEGDALLRRPTAT